MTHTSSSIVIFLVRYGFLPIHLFELIIFLRRKMVFNSSFRQSFLAPPQTQFSTKFLSPYGICEKQGMILASRGKIGILSRYITRWWRILPPIIKGLLHSMSQHPVLKWAFCHQQQADHGQHCHKQVSHHKCNNNL